MSRVRMPKRRAVSACPSSCSTMQPNITRTKKTAKRVRVALWLSTQLATTMNPTNSRKVACM